MHARTVRYFSSEATFKFLAVLRSADQTRAHPFPLELRDTTYIGTHVTSRQLVDFRMRVAPSLPPDARSPPEIRKCVKSRIFLLFYRHFACFCVLHAHASQLGALGKSRGRVPLPGGDLRSEHGSESRPVRPPTTPRSRGGRVRPPTRPPDAVRASVRPPTRSRAGYPPSARAVSRSRSMSRRSRSRSWSLHHRHDGALDCHVMNCSALAPRYEAFNLSSQDHLPANA